ncbi:putative transcription factor MYB-HB-like family [Helianthus anomalus]
MDPYSSAPGENPNIKTRKPYTITKQRERWTEEEHNSFLEALKLYGRAWQRIEEHIGTKTAVQIRSHAQKFFTKLEKEAEAKGVPIRQSLDIEIPPPRPKRKPSYPYPRKTRTQVAEKDAKPASLVSSLQSLDLERKPLPEKTSHQEKLENEKTNEEAQNGTTCASLSSENENSVPRSNHETNTSYITIETRKHQELDQDGIKHTNITSNISLYESSHLAHENIIQGRYPDMPPVNPINDTPGVQSCYPRHVPVQVVDGNHESTVDNSGEVHDHPNPYLSVNIAASATSGHHNDATLHPPFTPFSDNQENYRSFIHFSSTISSLIVSTLLQNPAAHAAATFAAKFYHPTNTEASSADSFSRDQLNPGTGTTPSMAAIAAATIEAATAWWSAHGLLPVCAPFFPGGYFCTFATPIDGNQANNEREKDPLEEKMNAEKTQSSSEDDDSDGKLNTEASPVETKETEETETVVTILGKPVDRSSCGSNTISSSEMQETKVSDVNEPIYRRGRSTINPNDSWKEVSEEGRLAFQALFSREVLPQSFSDARIVAENDQPNCELDLNRMSQEPTEYNGNEGVLRMGVGSVKLNVHHTGFKPYKRCSVEAKESSKIMCAGGQNDEKGPKRMCLETEEST